MCAPLNKSRPECGTFPGI